MTSHRKLIGRLAGAVSTAFLASLALTWVLHDRMALYNARNLIDIAFHDVEGAIREKVDRRLVRQAMAFRDHLPSLRKDSAWNDAAKARGLLRKVAEELAVDELRVVGADGIIKRSTDRRDIGFDFRKASGTDAEFLPLLNSETEIAQTLLPDSRDGKLIKYVGVWLPEGGFVQVGCREANLRALARSAITGLTHNRHVSGRDGFIVITTANGTIISHPEEFRENGQWRDPDKDCYWRRMDIEGFPVYVVIPKRSAVVERRVLVVTSAFLNGVALVFAAFLVGLVIAAYVRAQLRAQRASEMTMASDIQESSIPRIFPPFPDERNVDIFASMKTAKEVGGDFYDFYFSGPRKITFLVADVSDKGVPAALFMMRAKTVAKGIAQTGKPVVEVVKEVNEALCEDNGANMFVTAWIGEIDLDSGCVSYVNAGHNPPVVMKAQNGGCSYLRTPPGLVLGAMPGVQYRSQEFVLAPGDCLYLYTDGVTEQPDEDGKLFGEDRLLKFLSEENVSVRPNECLAHVLARITNFAGEREQADDITQLIIRYNGPTVAAEPQAGKQSRLG